MGARATHDPGTATLCSRTDDFSVNLAASVFGRSPSGLVAITDLFFEEDTDDFGTPAQSGPTDAPMTAPMPTICMPLMRWPSTNRPISAATVGSRLVDAGSRRSALFRRV